MPEQNQPIQGNFGGIFNTATPNLDRVTQQLQQQYADRKAFIQKESENTDNLLTKEMANIRSVDTPDIIGAYNQYKAARQNQLFNKSIQNNPKLYAEAQQEANANYGKLMSMINKSKQYNDYGKQMASNRLSKPDAYSDDAGNMLSQFYKTPMDQLNGVDLNGKKVDLTNPDNFRYQGGNFDFAKLHNTAVGKPVTHYDDGTTDASGVQTTQHGFQFGNTPGQYREVYLGGLATNQAHRGALYNWSQRDPQEVAALDNAYANSPNWKKLGISPQSLPPYNPNDPAGNEATYQAKKYLVEMNPAEVKAASITNQAAKVDLTAKRKLQGQEVMEAIKEGNREKMAGIRHDYKQMDAKEQSRVLDESVANIINKAKSDPDKKVFTQANPMDISSVTPEYKLDVGPDLKKALSISNPDKTNGSNQPTRIDADDVYYNETKGTVTPIFYLPGKPHTPANIDRTYSRPMTLPEFSATFGKTYFGTKEAAKESATTPTGSPKKAIAGW